MRRAVPAWFGFAVLSFLGFGVTNALLGAIFEWSGRNPATPVTAPLILWLTMGVAGLVAAAVFAATGRGYRGLPAPRFAVVSAAAGVSLALGMLTLKLGLASDPGAKGPIVAIASTNAMIVAAGARVVLREQLSRMQLVGMCVIVAGIAAMALGQGATASLRGLAFGLATMLCFGVTNFLLKYAGHHGTDSVTATAILWLSAGGCGALAVALTVLRRGRLPGMESPALIAWAIVAGTTLALGMLCIKLAVTRGPGGPATAITGSNSILVALFEFFAFAHVPPPTKILGMAVALVGIVVLALGGRHGAPGRVARDGVRPSASA
jgi:transporter family protein